MLLYMRITCITMLATVEIFFRRGKKNNIACIPMRKCVFNEKNPTPQHLINDVAIVSQSVSLSPSSLSEGHYNTLQFNYDTGCNFPTTAYASFPTNPHEDLSSCHHKNHNSNSFACSDGATRIRHSTTNIAILQANGYVLPDDFGKQLHASCSRSSCADESQMKSANKELKAGHDTAFTLKPDGTGIIRTGTLQAIIPSLKKDEDYMVTPSKTHESYFDVVKNT